MREIEVGLHGLQLQVDLTPLENEPLRAVRALRLYDERYMLLTAADGAHGRADRVRWADAAAAGRLGLLSRDMQHRRIVDGAFAAVGAEPRPAVETNSIAALSAHARDGLAAAVMAHTWLRLFPVPPGMRAVPPRSPSSAGRSAWCGSIADPSRSCRGR